MEPRKNKAEINKFISEVQETYGGDTPECYELVLKTANEQLAWRTDAEKILVLIGDAEPHDKNYYLNKDGIDWRKEIEKLKKTLSSIANEKVNISIVDIKKADVNAQLVDAIAANKKAASFGAFTQGFNKKLE